MVVISIIIRKDLENCSAFTCQVYVLTVFDTNRKRPSPAASTEKGHKTRASEVSHLFDASFVGPFSA